MKPKDRSSRRQVDRSIPRKKHPQEIVMGETASTFAVRGEFTIFTAKDLKSRLMESITAAKAGIDIDLADVTEMDTAGIQLMLLAKNEAAAAGKSIHFVCHSQAVLDLIDLYGLAHQLGHGNQIRPQA